MLDEIVFAGAAGPNIHFHPLNNIALVVAGFAAIEACGHLDFIGVYGKVGESAALEGKYCGQEGSRREAKRQRDQCKNMF